MIVIPFSLFFNDCHRIALLISYLEKDFWVPFNSFSISFHHQFLNIFHKMNSMTRLNKLRSSIRTFSTPRMKKAVMTLTPSAVNRLKELLNSDNPQYLKIGTKKKGCSGLSYTLDYVQDIGKFDEVVIQDGVRLVIDSKALFSLIGTEMDFQQDQLASQFTFSNPNVKGQCGCGESFMV
ncbi:hypothetical protein BC833DRAFT_572368 [Globomyces pollinis-pini]|nr:hypothetical protein BC833DRAFT_572368 [Globomyces pollinis-pini]